MRDCSQTHDVLEPGMQELPSVTETKRETSPARAPQALAWHDGVLWMGSRDLRRIYAIDSASWTVREELGAPGIPWAAVSDGAALRFTLGEGPEDNRYLRRFDAGTGWSESDRIACPEFTGSYLSYDGENLYLSQWYEHRILKLDASGNILRSFDVGAEICGHTFVGGMIYVLRGTEQNGEQWRIARFNPRLNEPEIEDLATVPLQCRSLAWDGEQFWSNVRAADKIVRFTTESMLAL